MKKYFIAILLVIIFVVIVVASAPTEAESKSQQYRNTSVIKVANTKPCGDMESGCGKLDAWGYAYDAMVIYNEQVSAYFLALEQQKVEEQRLAAAQKAVNVNAPVANSQSFDMPSECTGKVLPAYIIMRESHCNYGALNVNGCGGNSCYGMYQIDGRHWSSWNGTPGACNDLDWTIPSDQDECANRLSNGGTNLRPWGG